MPTPIVYPSALISPSTATTTSPERRLLGSSGSVFSARAVERDVRAEQQLVFPPMTPLEAAAWWAWWRDVLTYGGAWFAAPWPLPSGMASGVRKFLGTPTSRRMSSYEQISATVEVRGRGTPPSNPIIACDLLLHCDESIASSWKDYSVHRHALTLNPRAGTISGSLGGAFSTRAGNLNQIAPGSRDAAYYASHSTININDGPAAEFGSDDFFISAWVNLSTKPALGMTLVDNWRYVAGAPQGGWAFRFGYIGYGTTLCFIFQCTTISFGLITSREIYISLGVDLPVVGALHNVAVSRSGPTLTTFFDGVLQQTTSIFAPGEAVQPGPSSMQIGASFFSGTNLIDGFGGLFDELYIAHGPGTGVDASYTVPTAEY